MYSKGDFVVHGNSGICEITEIAHINMSCGDKNKEYYLLVPVHEKNGKIYLPVGDDQSLKIRLVLTKEQALDLINSVPELEEKWIENEKVRELTYKDAIRSCDCRELIKIIKTLYMRKKKRLSEGKKSTATDDRYFKLAEDNLYNELAFVLGKSREEIKEMIAERVVGKEKKTFES